MHKILCMISLIVVLAAGCNQQPKQSQAVSSDNHHVHASLLVINLLDRDYYDDAHIKGSVQVLFEHLTDYVHSVDKNTPIIVYCSNYQCGSSAAAWQLLKSLGFANIWAYEGGMAEWFQLGLPTKGPAQKPYLKRIIAKPAAEEEGIRLITAQELKEKMEEHKLL
jgi:rhodanese-related sulfurtransferase